MQELDPENTWILYVDGSVGQQHKRAGFVLERIDWTEFSYALKYSFLVSHNESKYGAYLAGLRIALAMNIDQLIIRGNSKVVFGQVMGSFKEKEDNMKKYSVLEKELALHFKSTRLKEIDRRQNQKADDFSKSISWVEIGRI